VIQCDDTTIKLRIEIFLKYPIRLSFRFGTASAVKIRASDMGHSKNWFGGIELFLTAIMLYLLPSLFYYAKIYFSQGINDFRKTPICDNINFNLHIVSLSISAFPYNAKHAISKLIAYKSLINLSNNKYSFHRKMFPLHKLIT